MASPAANREIVERFFRGVYEGNPTVVESLAAEDIVATYPVFAELFETPALSGRNAYRAHAENFAATWTGSVVTVHDSVAEGNKVVLLWSFRGYLLADGQEGEERRWGGITLFEINEGGQVAAEIGEESEPGPHGRISGEPAARDE